MRAREQKRAQAKEDEGVKEGYPVYRSSFLETRFGGMLPKWVRICNKKGIPLGDPTRNDEKRMFCFLNPRLAQPMLFISTLNLPHHPFGAAGGLKLGWDSPISCGL